MKSQPTNTCANGHTYSNGPIDQKWPRRCIVCSHPEAPDFDHVTYPYPGPELPGRLELQNKSPAFFVGELVKKKQGYNFPGVIVAVFLTTKSAWRYVVECTVPGVEGMLHIYSEKDLERR